MCVRVHTYTTHTKPKQLGISYVYAIKAKKSFLYNFNGTGNVLEPRLSLPCRYNFDSKIHSSLNISTMQSSSPMTKLQQWPFLQIIKVSILDVCRTPFINYTHGFSIVWDSLGLCYFHYDVVHCTILSVFNATIPKQYTARVLQPLKCTIPVLSVNW